VTFLIWQLSVSASFWFTDFLVQWLFDSVTFWFSDFLIQHLFDSVTFWLAVRRGRTYFSGKPILVWLYHPISWRQTHQEVNHTTIFWYSEIIYRNAVKLHNLVQQFSAVFKCSSLHVYDRRQLEDGQEGGCVVNMLV